MVLEFEPQILSQIRATWVLDKVAIGQLFGRVCHVRRL